MDFSQFSCSVMSETLQPHGLQHASLHCPSPTPRVQTHVHQVSDAVQPSHPLSPPSPAFSLSQHQGLFHWVSSSHQVAKLLEFSFSISPSNEYLGLISFRMDWLDLLAVQGTLKSLLQHHSSKASVLQTNSASPCMPYSPSSSETEPLLLPKPLKLLTRQGEMDMPLELWVFSLVESTMVLWGPPTEKGTKRGKWCLIS